MIPILVIRHAPTDWNRAGLIQGRTDRPLDEKGRATARAWRLPPEWRGAACLASPLKRAMETAEFLGLDPQPDARLIETDWGAWEGRRLADVRGELGDEMARNEARGLDFCPPGGESPRHIQERLLPLLRELTDRTVLVTHKGVLRPLYALATGWTMTSDPPRELRDGCAHSFEVLPEGAVRVAALNIPLASE
jgi:broad specificity phosphatase PhoE